jgi:hypothetical protein
LRHLPEGSLTVKLLDSLTVQSSIGEHRIELYLGDLTDMPPEQAVDVMVVSAWPNNYRPLKGTLIGALQRRGLSVRQLADDKLTDMREFSSCWLSKAIETPEHAGDIYRALLPFVFGPPNLRSVAVPLVATGKQGTPTAELLDALIDNTVNWLGRGTPLEVVRIVEIDPFKAGEMKGAFGFLKKRYARAAKTPTPTDGGDDGFDYDVFISYSRKNEAQANWLYQELQRQRPELRLFIDRVSMRVGASWQQKLYKALDDSRQVVALLSPDYIASTICLEEFNIAVARNRDREGVLVPMLIADSKLPTYMRLINYIDCRGDVNAKLSAACAQLGLAD